MKFNEDGKRIGDKKLTIDGERVEDKHVEALVKTRNILFCGVLGFVSNSF